ncbi:hypothetical protein BARVI_05810 [Barnesiella viscericola DSM 18177]|uniref:Uncharacterized protein n=1 Tax=Barnesiella viscericola DSM 18177 TaxID=880074 RepID=W0ESM7_9BACT|nr:hypothetical protein BARVI_05810 [Barnesiella viscericola DSM 18177]
MIYFISLFPVIKTLKEVYPTGQRARYSPIGEQGFPICRCIAFAIFSEESRRLGSVKLENSVFVCHSPRLSLSFQKKGGGSALSNSKTLFSFATALAFHYL